MTLRGLFLTATAVIVGFGTASKANAQATSHGIAAVVNDDIITTHDLRQRVLFMLATTGSERDQATIARLQQQALQNLIDEHIQLQESNKFEQNISDAEVNRSVARLIGRNGLDPNEVAQQLASIGVSINTLRDQVKSEIAWQRIVNGLYGSRIRISDAQIDQTMSRLSTNADKPSYRVAEIFIEATPEIGGMDGAMEGGKAMVSQATQGAPFPLLAQQFSSAPSAAKGGDVGWIRRGELRPELDAALETLEKGEISPPIQVPGGVYVIAMLDERITESDTVYKLRQVNIQTTDEAEMAAAMARLDGLSSSLTSCDTLEDDVEAMDGVGTADMGEVKASEISGQILTTIEATEAGQLSAPFETPSGPVALFVCDRQVTGAGIPTRTEVEERLMDQQLAQASKRHLRDLRRQATIMMR
ncbi:peptidylprolyl isomerase [Fretibacter rubidus]|uniref:peptidylprolyl isomerase n=1 Tax=Fretibacter rubidus TaxID=570162 RepID=UPI00352A5B84